MAKFESDMMRVCEDKAEQGDGQFATAYAILVLAREVQKLQENLTFGDMRIGSSQTPGCLEYIGMSLKDISESLALSASRANGFDDE